ncbi:ubiquitin carboxyl-terminal hydrolase 10-like [Melitaea cinxia]|uniref:ubiquitin carboxyl-terminal hydrolase 10-like n=1 Tax=Melitaea cinxia TaxID=113334 RepID=UPI001E2712BD|nr:ubiquitin carboxyl-terminal hydrolase 10-like [Melitaea cinxia]
MSIYYATTTGSTMVGNNAREILQPPPTKTWASLFEAKTGNKTPINQFPSNYQSENRPISLLPRSLTNRSNYCYVNAILQALFACSPFNNMLTALPSSQARSGNSSTPSIDSLKVLCSEYSMVASSSRSGHRRTAVTGPPLDGFASVRVLRALRQFSGAQGNRQEDAEEFLSCILNTLNDEMLEVIKANEPEEPTRDAIKKSNSVVAQDQSVCTVRRTPVADIFRGLTRTRLHRAPNHNVTDNVQPFFTLQLDIERSNTVQDALELLAAKDAIESVPGAWQQLSFARLPLVLLLHLKCYQVDGNGHAKKIIKNFDFPVDLNIHPSTYYLSVIYKSTTSENNIDPVNK